MSRAADEYADIRWTVLDRAERVGVGAVDLRTGKAYKPPSYDWPYLRQRESLLEQIRAARAAEG